MHTVLHDYEYKSNPLQENIKLSSLVCQRWIVGTASTAIATETIANNMTAESAPYSFNNVVRLKGKKIRYAFSFPLSEVNSCR